ncbi:MAG: AAA family ATPase [Deltaproteobacteria bacterium]|jgi:hypothetical protein|nr:AAA family ATPase [Deltaproteobacteria bacterium]
MGPKELPLGDPPFREIIQGNLLYADKTGYIYRLIKSHKCCFLTRPRRFGKTLLIKTVEELFLGNRELFKGLLIDKDTDYAFERHPVLRFNMAYTKISSKEDLEFKIERDLGRIAERESIKIVSDSYDDMLEELLEGLSRKHGTGAVILIDEYDYPVSNHIGNLEFASANRDVLHGFYTSLKRNIDYIRFALVAGITRFAMTGLDSGPNNFEDISLLPEFAGICGFTLSEFETLFEDRLIEIIGIRKDSDRIAFDIEKTALKAKILKWYDGYNWLGPEPVLNPYSILSYFRRKVFDSYWTSLGQPSHLSALVRKNPLEFIQAKLDGYTSQDIGTVDLGNLSAVPVLYHSGYLTIDNQTVKDVVIDGETIEVTEYTLRTPNLEVKLNFRASFFAHAFGLTKSFFGKFATNLTSALLKRDPVQTAGTLHDLLSLITHRQHRPEESRYHAILQGAFAAAGIEVLGETAGSIGQADMALFLNDKIRVVIELKYRHEDTDADEKDPGRATKDLSSALDEAETAIREKEYDGPFRLFAKEVICLALAVRGRNKVAARFIDPDMEESQSAS